MKVFLIRHGETEWNREQVFRGHADVPLSEKGFEQAKLVGTRMAEEKLAAVYTSPLVRSTAIADAIASELSLEPDIHDSFKDFCFGEWEGLPAEEVKEKFPEEYDAWVTEPATARIPGGDLLEQVALGSMDALRELAVKHAEDEAIAVVSHRVIIKLLVLSTLDMPLNKFRRIKVDTTSISRLDWDGERFHLAGLNDTCHLAPLDRGDEVDF